MKKAIILFVLVLMVSVAFADREITGEITCDGLYTAGTTNTIEAILSVSSPDVEWVTSIDFTFPAGVTPAATQENIVNGSYHLDFNNVSGQTITWGLYDTYDLGYLSGNGSPYTISFIVDIAADFSGNLDVDYNVDGEDYGAPPHSFSGTFTVDPALDDDLVALAVSGNPTPSAESPTIYAIDVFNQGQNAATNFDVTLYEGEGNLVGSVTVTELAPGATESYNVEWTPAASGTTYLYGVVDYAADMNTDNNQTPNYNVSVQAADVFVVTVGENTGNLQNYMPANFFWKNSLSEAWYYPEEFGVFGLVTTIQYFNNFYSTGLEAGTPLKIWMGESTQADGEAAWVPSTDLELVFDGNVSLPAGANDIMINLDTPFVYTGASNLVVMVQRPMDTQYWSSSDKWECTVDDSHPNRTRYIYSDSSEIDPSDPDAAGLTVHMGNEHPNMQFFMNPEDHGMMDGYVYQDTGRDPIAGATVTVTIDDMDFTQTTDATGYYYFPFLFVGDHQVTASAHGYYDTTEDITITIDELLTHDIYLEQLPNVTVTGHVITSDTGADVEGATVTLEGYENYEAITGADGIFTIAGVYSDQVYTMTIEYEGYETYVNDAVSVGTTDLDLGDVIVEEIAMSAVCVIAEENHEGNALIVWSPPGGGVETEYILDDGTYENGLAGNPGYELWLGNQFIVDASGTLTSFQIYAEGTGTAELEVDIFDADQNLVGSSESFVFINEDWVTIPCDNIPFTDEFYAMVHWNMETGSSCYMGMDEDGPNSTANYDWYRDSAGTWQNTGDIGYQCVFMIRATAFATGRSSEVVLSAGNNNVNTMNDVDIQKAAATLTSKPISGVAPATNTPEIAVSNTLEDNTRLLESYNVHRLLEGNENDPVSWTEITTGVTDTMYIDTTWPSVDPGVYKYAVTAVYTNGVLADPAFSNTIESDMTAAVTVNVTTNGGDDAAGAMVTMTNIDGDPEHVYTAVAATGGSVNFPEVWLGVYDLDVTLDGYEAYASEGINVFDVMTIPVELTEIIAELGELTALYLEDGNVHLSWAPTGASTVLLVDDDGSAYLDFSDTQSYYTAVLDQMDIDYTIHDIVDDAADGPDAATMGAYDVVIWECGEQWSAGRTLTANDETNLGTYIDNGGKLILNAHDYLYDAYSGMGSFSAGQFPYDYLGLASASQDVYTIGTSQGGPASDDVIGATGSYVDGLTVQITDIFSDGRDGVYIDDLTPNANGAVYATCGGYNAGVQTAGAIFTTAGFAGLVDGTNTVVDWFTYSINNLFIARDRAFLGYTVTRDGTEIATGVMEMEYDDVVTANGTYTYGVTGVYSSGNSNTITASVEVTDLAGEETTIPVVTKLQGNYPNPFNPTTAISFSVVEAGNVTIDIFNIKGEKVKTLVDGYMEPNFYNVQWNGNDDNNHTVASGVYFYKMKAGRYTSTKKMILMK